MKRAAIIFLVFVYAFSTTGVAVKADYCCDHLKSINLVLADRVKDKEGCCKVKYQSFKVNDAHAASDVITAPALYYGSVNTLPTYEISNLNADKDNQLVNIHAPPLFKTTPVYISNCVFRI